MPPKSRSYLPYPPPVVWSNEEGSFLGGFLLGFEKILNGFDDGKSLVGGEYRSLEAVIDALRELFDPRRTRATFLDWLAMWVALKRPPGWDDPRDPGVTESRKRAVIAGA